MTAYRISWFRPGGWTRLGLAGAVAIMFGTPMMWSLGVFGDGDEALKRAMIFLFAGMWFAIGVGYTLGWALRGFMVRLKEPDDDEDGAAHRPAGPGHAPAHPPAGSPLHRPGH